MTIPRQDCPDSSSTVSSESHRQPLHAIKQGNLDGYEIGSGNEIGSGFSVDGIKNDRSPQSQKHETIDAVLAKELNKLTFRERESVNDEIHGIGVDRKYIEELGHNEETPERLDESFKNMQTELDNLRSINGDVGGSAFAFNRSQELFGSVPEKGTYMNTKKLRIMFLRNKRFDCKEAALLLCRFADMMRELFGDLGLERFPLLSDMSDDVVVLIKNGKCQILPGRDRAGRRVYTSFFSNSFDTDIVSARKRISVPLYILMHLLFADVVSQQRGIVVVFWMRDSNNFDMNKTVERGRLNNWVASCIPCRMGAVHCCFPTSKSTPNTILLPFFQKVAARLKRKTRVHTGSPLECIYMLESFGINAKNFPLNIAASLDLTNHKRWLELRCAIEENNNLQKSFIECPTYSDILFGRGQIVMNHPGNIMFRNYIQSKLEVYSSLNSKKESTQWTWSAIRTLKTEYGARFLKEERIGSDITVWVEVSNDVARSKVRIAFRDARTRLAKSSKKEKKNCNKSINDAEIYPRKKRSFGDGILSATFKPSSSKSMSNNDETMPPDDFTPIPLSLNGKHERQPDAQALNLESINDNLRNLNDNLSKLNSNIKNVIQIQSFNARDDVPSSDTDFSSKFDTIMQQEQLDSSTSDFIGMDGSNSKRQRLCSQNFFNCF